MLGAMVKRLSGEEARARILDAAVDRLRADGPGALRLDAIAKELGISRQAILHHFGTRDDLIAAVVHRAFERLERELIGGLSVLSDRERGSAVLVRRAFDVIVDGGYGRLLGWLALEHRDPERSFGARSEHVLESLARMSQQIREREVGPADYRDTVFTFVLCSYAILGSAVFEEGVMRSAGLEGDPSARTDFREWLSSIIVAHLENPKKPA
jgi:AcrR family transcriptional regulator